MHLISKTRTFLAGVAIFAAGQVFIGQVAYAQTTGPFSASLVSDQSIPASFSQYGPSPILDFTLLNTGPTFTILDFSFEETVLAGNAEAIRSSFIEPSPSTLVTSLNGPPLTGQSSASTYLEIYSPSFQTIPDPSAPPDPNSATLHYDAALFVSGTVNGSTVIQSIDFNNVATFTVPVPGPVPEPSSWLIGLVVIGFCGWNWLRESRLRKALA